LKRYLADRMWMKEDDEDDEDESGRDDDDKPDDDANSTKPPDMEDDERFLQQADEFEHAYNFRFEQAGSHQIVGHPRVITDVVRKKDDKRARKRKEKAERKEAERKAAEEELKRMKNLKKMEIQDRLLAVQEVAGVAAPDATLVDALLEGDFDPDEYDRRMAAAFGEEYYDKAEEEQSLIHI
jgi:protein KRI1